jgi:hypothetical protein
MSDEVLAFLRNAGHTYCFPCLRRAFPGVAVREQLEQAQRRGAPIMIGDGRCGICATADTTTVAYVPGDPRLLHP